MNHQTHFVMDPMGFSLIRMDWTIEYSVNNTHTHTIVKGFQVTIFGLTWNLISGLVRLDLSIPTSPMICGAPSGLQQLSHPCASYNEAHLMVHLNGPRTRTPPDGHRTLFTPIGLIVHRFWRVESCGPLIKWLRWSGGVHFLHMSRPQPNLSIPQSPTRVGPTVRCTWRGPCAPCTRITLMYMYV